MTFFKQFNQLVKSLEKDVEEFRLLDHLSQKSEAEHETAGQKALLAANGLQSQVTELQKCMEETTKSLQIGAGFLDLVAVTEALVTKQKANLNQVEEYLQQYGYQPLPEKSHRKTVENGGKSKTGSVRAEPENIDSGAHDETNNHDNHERQNSCKEDCPTPEKTSELDFDEIMRTPRLEDFGLSEERLNQYKTCGAALKPSQHTKKNHAVPEAVIPESHQMQMKGCYINEGIALPVDFQHAGLCPTPGFTGGRDSTNRHDNNFPQETPQVLRSKHKNADTTWTSQDDEDSDFTKMLCLPNPPVLLTPGVKQIKKLNVRYNPAPVLHMGDILENAMENRSLEDNGLSSPVPPVMCTPGVKQLKKPSQMSSGETKMPILSFASDCMDTPEMPELTMGWIGLKSMTAQTTDTLGTTKGSNYVMGNSGAGSVNSSVTTASGINPSEVFNNIGKSSQPVQSEEESLPAMPELTSTQRLNWGTGHGHSVVHTGMGEDVFPSPDCSRLTTSHDLDVSPLPQMPELTGTYNFSLKLSAVTGGTTDARDTSQSWRKPRNDPSKGYHSHRVQDKENVAPEATQCEKNYSNCCKPASRLSHISEAEYSRQPDYVQRIVSLDLLNRALMDLEQILLDKEQGGQNVCVTERDLQPVLDSRTKPVILSLTKLGRLKLMRQGQEPAYIPVT